MVRTEAQKYCWMNEWTNEWMMLMQETNAIMPETQLQWTPCTLGVVDFHCCKY